MLAASTLYATIQDKLTEKARERKTQGKGIKRKGPEGDTNDNNSRIREEKKEVIREESDNYSAFDPSRCQKPWTVIPMIHKRDQIDYDALYAMKICNLYLQGQYSDISRLILSSVIEYPSRAIIYDAIIDEWKSDPVICPSDIPKGDYISYGIDENLDLSWIE
ncbi:ORF5 [Apple rootstock virus A]|uniref:ORF5 n=1 Tax=Apple rootstock virus A TaxID=2563012 RepID=A0A4D6DD68_9RHAB|nr:ORF5 [Apple rootstock virus A]QBZ28536.1 ORF5 [Apple rootstock virus A]